jgi:phospholipase C
MQGRSIIPALAIGLASLAMLACPSANAQVSDRDLEKIETIVVIYPENRSFDHLYGAFPGANGIAQASEEQKTQLDHDGTPLPYLVVFNHGKPDPRFPILPNRPFSIEGPPLNLSPAQLLPNPVHAFFHNQEQINGGRNNMFAAMSNVGGWTMAHFDGKRLKAWRWASEYTLADNFFMGAFGGSFLNHHWLICACTPRFVDAPAQVRVVLDEAGRLKKKPDSPSATKGAVQVYSTGSDEVTADGFAINTFQPPYQPSGIAPAPGGNLDLANPAGDESKVPLPAQNTKTIGDTLSAKGIGWAWYAGGWRLAEEDGRRPPGEKRRIIYNYEAGSPIFLPHHQPFNYHARFAPGTEDRTKFLKDGDDFFRDMDAGTLPPVAFYKPVGRVNEHPGYTDLITGDEHINEVLERLRKSPQWGKMLVIVSYDENGGFWDHAPPPQGDRFGPGTRIATLIVSPFARRGFIDHTPYDTTSIIKLVTRRFALEPLPGVRAQAGDLTSALRFEQ